MPVKVTKYTCGFKCGTRATCKIAEMVKHEFGCFKNPENKTCATCANAIYETEHEEFTKWHSRGCKIDVLNDFLAEFQQDLTIEPSGHIKPLWHCPNHDMYKEQDETVSFISEVKGKIEAKNKTIETSENLHFL